MILSVFPGIDLFGRAFEEEGLCVVRGPDLLWGGDVRRFKPDSGWAWGVIGGSPCQDFSRARRGPMTGNGWAMLEEFRRVVVEAAPEWWLLENVPGCPDLFVPGYGWQRTPVNQGWYSGVNRNRHFQFGSRVGVQVDVPAGVGVRGLAPAALGHDARGFKVVCGLQGLGGAFVLPPFKIGEKIRAVGNGVPLVLGRTWARAILRAYGREVAGADPVFSRGAVSKVRCACGCGRIVRGRQLHAGASCRKRAERRRAGVNHQAKPV
jgi:DNA (cytosine-5)-methyltransferase 1